MRRVVGWILLALVIFYIGTNPGPAAEIARHIGSGLGTAARNIGVFLKQLAT